MTASMRDEIDQLPYCAEGVVSWLELLRSIERTDDLDHLVANYNWDDGFVVPLAVSNHAACDLGIALKLFWLAEGQEVFATPECRIYSNQQWIHFVDHMVARITNGEYAVRSTAFEVPVNSVAKRKLRNKGVPSILLTDLSTQ